MDYELGENILYRINHLTF